MFQAYKQAYKRPYEVPLAGDPRNIIGGAEGFWLDFTDMSTMFQDSAGTIPVTALGDPVGLVRDKSGNGYDATQSTSAARPTFGRMPRGGVRNRFTRTQEFSNAAWGKSNCTATDNQTTAPDGTLTGGLIVEAASTINHNIEYLQIPLIAGTTYAIGCYAKAKERNLVRVGLRGGASNYGYAEFNVSAGTVSSQAALGSGWAVVGATAVDAGNGWWLCILIVTAGNTTTTQSQVYLSLSDASATTDAQGRAVYAGNGTSGAYFWSAQFEQGSTATPYQKVVQTYDVTESGVASVPCLWFDGVDDHFDLSTALNLTANLGRLTLAATCSITKVITSTQSVVMFSTGAAIGNVRARICGSPTNLITAGGRRLDADAYEEVTTTVSSYQSNSYTAVFDYAQAALSLRKNGAVVATDNSFQTAGNTSNSPALAAYIGRTSSAYLGGFISGAFAIRDTTLTANQLASLENYFMQQMGVAA